MKPIKHATSFETAHFIPDYPAGFTARVTKKMWIETDPKERPTQRVCHHQPKGNPNKWCAPKANTYDDLIAVGVVEASDIGTHGFETKDVGHAHFIALQHLQGCSVSPMVQLAVWPIRNGV